MPGEGGALKTFPPRNLAPEPEKSWLRRTGKNLFQNKGKRVIFKWFLGYGPQTRVATPKIKTVF
jgi:hypothetical protein